MMRRVFFIIAFSLSCVMAKRTQTRFIARMIEGAVPSSATPGFIPPQLATLKSRRRPGNAGSTKSNMTAIGARNKDRITIFNRNGHDWTKRFSLLAKSFALLRKRCSMASSVLCRPAPE
jgi:hypothetical protein